MTASASCRDECVCRFQMGNRRVEIDISALVIEMDANVGITLRRFDYGRVERGASDRVDTFLGINIVRSEMQRA